MKLFSLLIVAGSLATVASAQATFPRTPGAGVLYSAHNFFDDSWNQGAGAKPNEVCGVCHIPHVEGRPSDRTETTPLWGRSLSTRTYTMYSSPTLTGAVDAQPTGSTRLCLGCHDGSVGLEMFHTGSGTTPISTTPTSSRILPGKNGATDFGADHPISIIYDVNDTGLRPVTSPFGVGSGTIADVLEGGKVQCATCHDIHNREVPTVNGTAYLRMTVADPANPSAICFACHVK